MKKWAIYIDIEGFRGVYLRYSDLAYELLIGLVTDVYHIMENVYPEPNLSWKDASLSLIAHQFGDGVVISPFPLGKGLDLFKPLCISIALLRTTAMRGGLAKAAISYGGMVDYSGLYPKD